MKPILRWGLWERRWSIFWWSFGLAAVIALTISVYPTFRDQAQLNKSLENIPETAKALITDTSDFLSPAGYLSSQLFYLTLPLLFSVLTIGLGSSLINREEQDGTLELLLSRPLSRGKLLLAKAGVGLGAGLIVSPVALIATVVCSKAVTIGIGTGCLALAVFMCFVIGLLFGSVAFMLSALGRVGRAASMGVAVLVALASYLISSLAETVSWLRWPAKVLPYHYYQPSAIMSGTYNWWNLAGMLVAIAVMCGIAYIGFRRRDIG